MSRTVIEWGQRVDCARNGCNPVHADDGNVSSWPFDGVPHPDNVVNNHAVTRVRRTVTYSDWEEA